MFQTVLDGAPAAKRARFSMEEVLFVLDDSMEEQHEVWMADEEHVAYEDDGPMMVGSDDELEDLQCAETEEEEAL